MKKFSVADVRNYYTSEKARKDRDSHIFLYYCIRPFSFRLSAFFLNSGLGPNHITWFTYFMIISIASLFSYGSYETFIVGSILLYFRGLFDAVDGNMARALGVSDRYGEFIDATAGYLFTGTVFFAIGIGLTFGHYDGILSNKINYDIMIVVSGVTSLFFVLSGTVSMKAKNLLQISNLGIPKTVTKGKYFIFRLAKSYKDLFIPMAIIASFFKLIDTLLLISFVVSVLSFLYVFVFSVVRFRRLQK